MKDTLKVVKTLGLLLNIPILLRNIYYNKKQTIEIIKLNGSVELAPIVGLSEISLILLKQEAP